MTVSSKMCRRGHCAPRLPNRDCVECARIRRREWKKRHAAQLHAGAGHPIVCKRGRRSVRTEDGDCFECQKQRRIAQHRRRWSDPDIKKRMIATISRWETNNPDKKKAYGKQWRHRNPAKTRLMLKNWYDRKGREYHRAWKKSHREYDREQSRRRQAAKLKAVPKWANVKTMREFYRNCPDGYEVDHIIPLRGVNVCGLHVENNLQYLTKAENIRKFNKFLDVS